MNSQCTFHFKTHSDAMWKKHFVKRPSNAEAAAQATVMQLLALAAVTNNSDQETREYDTPQRYTPLCHCESCSCHNDTLQACTQNLNYNQALWKRGCQRQLEAIHLCLSPTCLPSYAIKRSHDLHFPFLRVSRAPPRGSDF
jgi:hypothetical protein